MHGILAAVFPAWFSGNERPDDARTRLSERARRIASITERPTTPDPMVARLRAGDAAAWADLHTAYAAELWRHAFYYVRDRDAAEDLVQDVFVTMWHRRTTLDSTTLLRPYLYAAVRNRALKQLRHQTVVDRATPAIAPETSLGPRHPDADTDATTNTLGDLVRRALAELPERQRTAIELRWLRHLNHTETATVLGISEAAVRKLLDKAIVRLEALRARLREPDGG